MKDFLIYNGSKDQYAKLFLEYEKRLAEYGKSHPVKKIGSFEAEDAVDFLQKPFPPSKVEVLPDKRFLLHVHGLYGCYTVQNIKSRQSLLEWIFHLSEKTWFDGELCHDLISAVCYVNKWVLT